MSGPIPVVVGARTLTCRACGERTRVRPDNPSPKCYRCGSQDLQRATPRPRVQATGLSIGISRVLEHVKEAQYAAKALDLKLSTSEAIDVVHLAQLYEHRELDAEGYPSNGPAGEVP